MVKLKAPDGYIGPREKAYIEILNRKQCIQVVGKLERLRQLDWENYHEDLLKKFDEVEE